MAESLDFENGGEDDGGDGGARAIVPADITEALGARLIALGKLDNEGFRRASRIREETGDRFNQILTKLGLVSERDMAEVLADQLEEPLVRAGEYPEAPAGGRVINLKFLKQMRIVPLAERDDILTLVMADPFDDYAIDAMRLFSGLSIHRRVGVPAEIDAAIERIYGRGGTIERMVEGAEYAGDEATAADIARLKDMASEGPVIRLVNHLVDQAVAMRASDIHIEPFRHHLKVRYRVDGVLREVEAPPLNLRAAVISRIKIMANLNIAEMRLPQDGRIRLITAGKEIDMRVATVPTMHGESAVLRLLDRDAVNLDFEALGFDGDNLDAYRRILDRPHGIVLVTGPTGSGKTTTLYTSLIRLNDGERKILTIEDPVEYQLEGVNQVQVKPQIGLSFAHALRSFLRHDPDVIMIGEIRDLETAEIAVQAALTGHKVLSTLHTNDAIGTITRLLDMGVEGYLLPSTLNGIVAQRLVRRLCQECREPHEATENYLRRLGVGRPGDGAVTFYRAVGCEACNGTGYRGRTSILEVLAMTPEIAERVLSHVDDRAEFERVGGFRSMYRDGFEKALAGLTSIEEVLRVTRET